MGDHNQALNIIILNHPLDQEDAEYLRGHLSPSSLSPLRVWHRNDVDAGATQKEVFEQEIKDAHIVVVLLSIDLLNWQLFAYLNPFLSTAINNQRQLVIPVLLRQCNLKRTLFRGHQLIPRQGAVRSIVNSKKQTRDEVFTGLANEIIAKVPKRVERIVESFEEVKRKPKRYRRLSSSIVLLVLLLSFGINFYSNKSDTNLPIGNYEYETTPEDGKTFNHIFNNCTGTRVIQSNKISGLFNITKINDSLSIEVMRKGINNILKTIGTYTHFKDEVPVPIRITNISYCFDEWNKYISFHFSAENSDNNSGTVLINKFLPNGDLKGCVNYCSPEGECINAQILLKKKFSFFPFSTF